MLRIAVVSLVCVLLYSQSLTIRIDAGLPTGPSILTTVLPHTSLVSIEAVVDDMMRGNRQALQQDFETPWALIVWYKENLGNRE